MAKKTSAYVDTGALIAFLDQSDTYHSLFERLFSDPPLLLSTPLIIAEGQAWFLKRYDTSRALQFMSFVDELKVLRLIEIGSADLQQSSHFLRKFSDQDLTLADACGLWVMKKHKVTSCWSTDRHLSLTGVPLVIHE